VSLRGLEAFEVLLSELRSAPVQQRRGGKWRQFQRQEIQTSEEKVDPLFTNVNVDKPTNFQDISPEIKQDVPQPEIKYVVPQPEIKQVNDLQPEVKQVPQFISQTAHNVKPVVEEEYGSELASLYQMGFANARRNQKVLKKTKGNLSQAVVLLLR